MSDFQVGDVVVCIDDSPCALTPFPGAPWRFPKGKTARVTEIDFDDDGDSFLGFFPFPDEISPLWLATRFKKITRADEQFTKQMRALKPQKVSA